MKLCDCVIWLLDCDLAAVAADGYDVGTTGVGTGAGNVGGGPGLGPPLPLMPLEMRRNCFDWRYMMVSPNMRVGDASS